MKQKQLEAIKNTYHKLSALGECNKPNLEVHISRSLCIRETPTLRHSKQIAANARDRIISGRYERNLQFSDVFEPTNSYKTEMEIWNGYQERRNAAVEKFEVEASKILIKAAHPDAVPEECIEALHAAAKKCGLKDLKPPTLA